MIGGQIRASAGNDRFTWRNGGQINSAILMGDGDDSALLSNLSENTLASTPSMDGGLGTDRLSFDNSTSAGAARYVGWESVTLGNHCTLPWRGIFSSATAPALRACLRLTAAVPWL